MADMNLDLSDKLVQGVLSLIADSQTHVVPLALFQM